MSDPYPRPTDQWDLIFYSSGLYRPAHTRQEWAQIADAITTADRHHRAGVRGGDVWCAIAVARFNELHDANAYADLRTDDRPVWHADERLIRAWLAAPSIPADRPGQTTLHDHGWNHTLAADRHVDPADLTMLVDLAQDAGVVGEPQHKVSLLRWVHDGVFRDDSFLVLVWRPDGPALPSDPVPAEQLLGAGTAATERAVAVLSGVASVANRLLATNPPHPTQDTAISREPADAVHAQPLRQGGRAFRLITGTTEADPPTLPPPTTAPKPPRHPHI